MAASWPSMSARKESESPSPTRWASPRRDWRRSSVRTSVAIWRPWDKCWRNTTVREIVVGLPLRLSGAEGTQSENMRRFADDLHAHFGLTVHLWDERWTSTEANRLLRETDLSIKKRGQAVDRMAAVLILQSWMQAHLAP